MEQISDLKEEIFELQEDLFQERWRNGQLQTRCNELVHDIEQMKRLVGEALQVMQRGGAGTRSQVQRLLEQAMEV